MSADNYIAVDHDGEQFIVYHGFMSGCEDPDYEPTIVGVFDTEKEVEELIDSYAIIEYGVNWLPAARAKCGGCCVHP